MRRIYQLTILWLILALSHPALAQDYQQMMRDPNANFYDIQKKFYEYWQAKGDDTMADAQEEDSEYEHFKRWERNMGPRVYPSGKMINPAAKALEAWQNEQNSLNNSSAKNSTAAFSDPNGNWISVGPTSYVEQSSGGGVGRVNCIAVDSTNANIIYCGTPDGGLWKTTVGGHDWIPLTDGIPDIGVSGIALNPNNEDEIYILTGDPVGDGSGSIGVLKSENGGVTWTTTALTNVNVGYKLMMMPGSVNTLFAITNNGIYKTTNGGVTWPIVKSGNFVDCQFQPGSQSVMYACTFNQFFRSNDAGSTWTAVTSSFISGISTSCPPPNLNAKIAVSPLNSNIVYILFSCGGTIDLGVSIDAGLSFTAVPQFTPRIWSLQSGQEANDLTFGIDPNNINYLYAGGSGAADVLKSGDGGQDWKSISSTSGGSPNYVHPDQRAMVFSGNTMYVGCDGGIFGYNTAGGSAFSDLTGGMAITQIWGLGGTPQNANLYYFGTQDDGGNRLDISTNINMHVVGGDGGKCLIDYTNQSVVYERWGENLERTRDGGATWDPFYGPGLGSPNTFPAGAPTSPIIMNPIVPTILYGANTSIYQTINGCDTWSKLYDFTGQQVDMAIGTDNTNHLYSAESNIIRGSTDGGINWTDVTGTTLPVSKVQITRIAVSTINANNVWVGMSGYGKGLKVFKSTGGGTLWSDISGTLPPLPINCLAITPGSPVNALYAGTDIGVYYTDDNLGYWIPFRNGLPNVKVNDLYINTDANTIAAGTFGRGLWVSDLYSSCLSDFSLTPDINLGSGGYQRYTSGNSVKSDIQYLGGDGTDIKYNAGAYIDLQPGFWFISVGGAIFDGYINGCPAQPAGSHPVSGTLRDDSNPFATSISVLSDSSGKNIQIIPNPFNSSFEISFNLDQDVKTHIDIFNLIGVKIKEVPEQNLLKGNNRLSFDCSDFANGVYLVEITCGNTKIVKKIIKN